MKKINTPAGFSPNYYYNHSGVSDDQADTYIEPDPNESNTGAGINLKTAYWISNCQYYILYIIYVVFYFVFRPYLHGSMYPLSLNF